MINKLPEGRYPFSVEVDGHTFEAVRSVSGAHRMSQSVRYGGRTRLDIRSYLAGDSSVMLVVARLMLRDMVNEELARIERSMPQG